MHSVARLFRHPRLFAGTLALTVIGGTALLYRHGDAQAEQAQAPQAVPVVTQTVAPQDVRVWSEFSGKLVAVDAAEIRPEVGGRITEIRFEDGQMVKAGDILYVIDPRPYEAALAKAEASLASAQTNASFARTELTRAAELIKTQAIAQRIYDERSTANRVADAHVKSAEADVKQARLDLEHAYVRAPISGKASRAEITVGNLVQTAPNAPLLTSIVANESIYADFQVDEQTYLQAVRSDAKDASAEKTIPVVMTLRSDATRSYDGTIHSFDNQIDGTSGTMRARAKFSNSDGSLIPGMFASVKMGSNTRADTLLVPERAIGTDQNKRFVYVVGEGNKVAYREVSLGASTSGQRIVESGLKTGERIVVDGVQHVRPDVVVAPTDIAAAPAKEVAMKQ